jgi:hypothetical protein
MVAELEEGHISILGFMEIISLVTPFKQHTSWLDNST